MMNDIKLTYNHFVVYSLDLTLNLHKKLTDSDKKIGLGLILKDFFVRPKITLNNHTPSSVEATFKQMAHTFSRPCFGLKNQ